MIRSIARIAVCSSFVWLASAAPAFSSFLDQEGVREFIDGMTTREDFNAAELRGLFENVERQEEVLEEITQPAESLPWHRYRPIFVTDSRVQAGAEFLRANAEALARAEEEFGVPPEIVTAIIGVETFYGRHKGGYPVLDTLATLAFAYPPRADFFRKELEQFLVLARTEGLDPRSVNGSYAGAMGMPQFISSSYRHYAIDFDDDGQRDLWNSTADVIGSVASYLERHGWRPGEPIAARVADGGDPAELVHDGLKPQVTPDQLRRTDVEVSPWPAAGQKVSVLELEGSEGAEYWVGWPNFYSITRYNHSALYAMAVFQLAERIGRAGSATAAR